MRTLALAQLILVCLAFSGCQNGFGGMDSGGPSGNEGGSDPINPTEEKAYKRAVLKCYKTGGSRVVKIEGQLMCY